MTTALEARAGRNFGAQLVFGALFVQSVKAELLQPVSTQDSLVCVGSADEIRCVPVPGSASASIRNTSGSAIDVSQILIRNGVEFVIVSHGNIANGASYTLYPVYFQACPLQAGDQVVLRIAKHGGGGDITSGVVAICAWGVLPTFDTFVADVPLDETAKEILTVPLGYFYDAGNWTDAGAIAVKNFDTDPHNINVFLNDVLVDVVTVSAGDWGFSDFLASNFSAIGFQGGWTLKAQLQEPVTTHAPACQVMALRRDSHD